MIYLKDYSKLEECISEEINKESSLLQSIYKETGDSEEKSRQICEANRWSFTK